MIAVILARHGTFPLAFGALGIPATVTLLLVFGARLTFPNAGRIVHEDDTVLARGYPRAFWWYLAGAAFVAFGFADYNDGH